MVLSGPVGSTSDSNYASTSLPASHSFHITRLSDSSNLLHNALKAF